MYRISSQQQRNNGMYYYLTASKKPEHHLGLAYITVKQFLTKQKVLLN